MILHNLTKKAAGAFLGTYLAVGGVDVAEGQDNRDPGGRDGKAWVAQRPDASGRYNVVEADVEFVHYDPKTRKVVPLENVRSVDIAPRGEKPRFVAQDLQGNRLEGVFVNTGSVRDGVVQESDINDLRAQGYKYEDVGSPQNIAAQRAEVQRIETEMNRQAQEVESQARAQEQAARAAAQPTQMSKADFMAALDRGAAAADRKGFESLKGDQAQWRNDYRAMRDIETALKSDPMTVTPAMRKAMEGPNADVINSYADAIAANGGRPLSPAAVAEHQLVLQNRMQGTGERELKQSESAPAAATAAAGQVRRDAPAPAQAAAGIGAVEFQQSLPTDPNSARNAALNAKDMSPQQFERIKGMWERVYPGSGAALQGIRDNPPDNPGERAEAVNKLQAFKGAQPSVVQNAPERQAPPAGGVDRNSSESVRNLPRVEADQGRDVAAEIDQKTMDRLRARDPAAAAIVEAARNGQDPYQALRAQANEGPVKGADGRATVVTLNDKPYVLWREQNGQHRLYDQADIARVYDRTAADMQGGNAIGAVAIRQAAVDAENALAGHEPSNKVNVTNPNNISNPAIREAVQAELAQPQPQASTGLGFKPTGLG